MASRTRRPASPALTGTALVETLLGGWRALSRLEVDGFAVLRSRGVTRRANSVVPLEPSSDPAAPDAAVTRIEGLLDAAGERPVFRLFTGEGLDHEPVRAALAQRGYEQDAPVHVLQRTLSDHRTAPDSRAVIAVGSPPEPWLEASWRLAPRPEDGARETLRDLMAGTPALYLALEDPDSAGRGPLAVGRAALVPHRRRTIAVLDQIAVDPGAGARAWAGRRALPAVPLRGPGCRPRPARGRDRERRRPGPVSRGALRAGRRVPLPHPTLTPASSDSAVHPS